MHNNAIRNAPPLDGHLVAPCPHVPALDRHGCQVGSGMTAVPYASFHHCHPSDPLWSSIPLPSLKSVISVIGANAMKYHLCRHQLYFDFPFHLFLCPSYLDAGTE